MKTLTEAINAELIEGPRQERINQQCARNKIDLAKYLSRELLARHDVRTSVSDWVVWCSSEVLTIEGVKHQYGVALRHGNLQAWLKDGAIYLENCLLNNSQGLIWKWELPNINVVYLSPIEALAQLKRQRPE